MKRTLYLSDLDGTLLDSRGRVSSYTSYIIRQFIELGGIFSIATARSFHTAYPVIQQLGLREPLLLNNGAVIFNPITNEVVQVTTIPLETVSRMFDLFIHMQITGFMYVLENMELKLYYQALRGPEDTTYYNNLVRAFDDSRIHTCENLLETARFHTPMFFEIYGPPERLNDVYKHLMEIKGISCSLYRDFGSDQYYYIDIYAQEASKSMGMQKLKHILHVDRVVAFGDNFNDVDMLEHADASYVPRNAVGIAKSVATEIIPSSDSDGVAAFLARLL